MALLDPIKAVSVTFLINPLFSLNQWVSKDTIFIDTFL